jgi:very-short-patch-repair endonuclease
MARARWRLSAARRIERPRLAPIPDPILPTGVFDGILRPMLFYFYTAALAALLLIAVVWWWIRRKSRPTYHAKPLMTANEREFLGRLEGACPELRFHAQVAMGALLKVKVRQGERSREWFRARGVFAQKIVDFVAEDRRSGELIAIIELDDRSHDPAKDAARDALLQAAGYRTIRWPSSKRPGEAAIRSTLLTTKRGND